MISAGYTSPTGDRWIGAGGQADVTDRHIDPHMA